MSQAPARATRKRRHDDLDAPPALSPPPPSSSPSSSSTPSKKTRVSSDDPASPYVPSPPSSPPSSNALTPTPRAPVYSDFVCPYLDTINRSVLDFDFEKLCSVSLSKHNVYSCLVCGRYFQGRGPTSHAYFHALEARHHVFINLQTERVYCLPDGYEVRDPSLEDIRLNLHPRFSRAEIADLSAWQRPVVALDDSTYVPGVKGLNNINHNDWLNVVVQALCRIDPIRDFFLDEANYAQLLDASNSVAFVFGELVRKLWSPLSFKSHVSPHELLQLVSVASDKQFRIGQQSDPLQFLSWFLDRLHRDLAGIGVGQLAPSSSSAAPSASKKKKKKKKKTKRLPSVIHNAFQGAIRVTINEPVLTEEQRRKTGLGDLDDGGQQAMDVDESDAREESAVQGYTTKVRHTPFVYLSLNLPPAPLFRETSERSLIPQVHLFELLGKFDGTTETVADSGAKMRYVITKLPRYLIVHVRRFKQNNWFVEKNPTLVNFPLRDMDLSAFVSVSVHSRDELDAMSVSALRKLCDKRRIDTSDCVEKQHLVEKVLASEEAEHTGPLANKYDLIANICHEGTHKEGSYIVHVFHKGTQKWFLIQDLMVSTHDTLPQQISLSESYLQFYERKA